MPYCCLSSSSVNCLEGVGAAAALVSRGSVTFHVRTYADSCSRPSSGLVPQSHSFLTVRFSRLRYREPSWPPSEVAQLPNLLFQAARWTCLFQRLATSQNHLNMRPGVPFSPTRAVGVAVAALARKFFVTETDLNAAGFFTELERTCLLTKSFA